jgi:hypothetical protein
MKFGKLVARILEAKISTARILKAKSCTTRIFSAG